MAYTVPFYRRHFINGLGYPWDLKYNFLQILRDNCTHVFKHNVSFL
jgi:hypothetical protein